jgi:hypothetical protein
MLRKFEDNNKGKDEREIADFAMDQDLGWVAMDGCGRPAPGFPLLNSYLWRFVRGFLEFRNEI